MRYFKKLAVCATMFMLVLNCFASNKKTALIWGNSIYNDQWQSLPVVHNDVEVMNKVFTSLGFQTKILHDGNIEEMKRSLKDFSNMSKDAELVVFYYSGHAVRIENRYYLIPAKTDFGTTVLPSDFFLTDDIFSATKNNRARLIFYDACRDGIEIEGLSKGPNPNVRQSINVGPLPNDRNNLPAGTMICYATERGQKAHTGNSILSIFTKALSDHLCDGDEFRTVWKNVVKECVSQGQKPVNEETYEHDLYLNPSGKKSSSPFQDMVSNQNLPQTNKKSITITTNAPNATIDISGTKFEVGKPILFEMGNTYLYTITANGYQTRTGKLIIDDSSNQSVSITMQKADVASLYVTSNTVADIYIDGIHVGRTPTTITTTTGAHSISLYSKHYYSYNTTIDLVTGSNSKHISLTRKRVEWKEEDRTWGITYNYGKHFPIGLSFNYQPEDTYFMIAFDLGVCLDKEKFINDKVKMTTLSSYTRKKFTAGTRFFTTLTPMYATKYVALGCGIGGLWMFGTSKEENYVSSGTFSSLSSNDYKLNLMLRPTVKGFIPISDDWKIALTAGYDMVLGYKAVWGFNVGAGVQIAID